MRAAGPCGTFQKNFMPFSRPWLGRTGNCSHDARSVKNDATRVMTMPKFVIEREIPGAGKLTPAELKTISRKSCGVLSSMGPSVQWVHSYVTGDKVYCIYHATDESLVRRHAELGGFPANKISQVFGIIDPSTAE